MGLFNIFKKNRAESKPQPTTPPTYQQADVIAKQSIADYFSFDIIHLSPDDYPERTILTTKELGMFPYVEVHSKEGRVTSVEFISHSKRFTPQVAEFINRCAATFGPTKAGESTLTQKDSILLQRGLFSRMWPAIWFECGPDEENGGITAVRITIFNPSQNGIICLTQIY